MFCWLQKKEGRFWFDIIELSFNSNEFGRELLTKPSMFGKLWVHDWRSCGGLNKEHSISVR